MTALSTSSMNCMHQFLSNFLRENCDLAGFIKETVNNMEENCSKKNTQPSNANEPTVDKSKTALHPPESSRILSKFHPNSIGTSGYSHVSTDGSISNLHPIAEQLTT